MKRGAGETGRRRKYHRVAEDAEKKSLCFFKLLNRPVLESLV